MCPQSRGCRLHTTPRLPGPSAALHTPRACPTSARKAPPAYFPAKPTWSAASAWPLPATQPAAPSAHPASTWWLHPATCHLLQATGAHVTATAFCSHGLDRQGAWLLACNTARCHSLASLCQHDPGQHPVVMLKRKREPQTSQPQPAYTDSFLQAAARCLQPLLPARTSPMQPWTQEPPAPTTLPAISRPAICDGAGLHSSADHSNATCQPALQQLRTAWLSWACSIDLPKRVACHLMQSKPEHPLSEAECAKAAELAHECLHPNCTDPACLAVAQGQPFRLQLLQALSSATADPDADIVSLMISGVPTGAFGPLPASKQWPASGDLPDDSLSPPALLHCEGNWKRAEDNPETLQALLAKEIEGGFVQAFDGDEAAAKARWPAGTAIGRLNVVFADERDARLVLDSSVCNLNARCALPEKMSMPSALDVRLSFAPPDPHGIWLHSASILKLPTNACMCSTASKAPFFSRSPASSTFTPSAISVHASAPTGGSAPRASSPASCTPYCQTARTAHGSMWMICSHCSLNSTCTSKPALSSSCLPASTRP